GPGRHRDLHAARPDARQGALHTGDDDNHLGLLQEVLPVEDPVDSRDADVVQAGHGASHQLGRDPGLLRDGNIGGPCGHHQDGAPCRLRRIADRDDRRLLMVGDPFSHKGLPKSIVHVRGGARRQDESLRFGHPAADLDDALRRFAETQDDFREASAQFPRSGTARARFAISIACSCGTTMRPDSSPTIQSPAWTFWPPQSISLPISPRPFGSPACGATWRLKHGKLSSRIVSRSRTAPSITTPATPFTRHEWLASSPQTAVGPPPTSITITSPGFARSIASTGFAQSPSTVFTVIARPTSFAPCLMRGTRPVITPRFCIASARFGVDTFRRASRTSASVYFLNETLEIALSPCIAFLIVRVASATFSALMIAPPTITIDAPAATACATVSEVRPPATATGSEVADATAFSSWRGVRAIICSSMDTCMFR